MRNLMGSRELNNSIIKKVFLTLVICFSSWNIAFASDNVLQAIQIDGVNDSYNIILKSDDVAEVKTTVQAPNKMIISLKGIRASKTINTIYNNTSSVDSVVVEPINDDSVKILVQAPNVSSAKINFDSLKTPLALEPSTDSATTAGSKSSGEIVLSEPTTAYRPIYNETQNDNSEFSFMPSGMSVSLIVKKLAKGLKANWMITFGLFVMLVLSGMKLVKGKDNEIKIGLSQSLRDRELDLYGSPTDSGLGINHEISSPYPNSVSNASAQQQQNLTGTNYGIRAYQQGLRNPYVTSELQKKKVAPTPVAPATNLHNAINNSAILKQQIKTNNINRPTATATATPVASKPISKSANIDSMKFLESMTKIYEKNGRADLAQGLKSNIKKAKINLG